MVRELGWAGLALVVCGVTTSNFASAQVLQNASFLGGSQFDHARDVTVDNQGFIYVTGGTDNPYWTTTQTILTPGMKESGSVQSMDIFVCKLDPTAQTIIWATRIGGPNYERAYAIEVDSQGYVYVAGRAGNGAPITNGAFQATFQGGVGASFYGNQDGYVLKLTPDGGSLVWASYFGADDALSSTIIRDIAIDADNNVYLAASVGSGAHYPAGVSAALSSGAVRCLS